MALTESQRRDLIWGIVAALVAIVIIGLILVVYQFHKRQVVAETREQVQLAQEKGTNAALQLQSSLSAQAPTLVVPASQNAGIPIIVNPPVLGSVVPIVSSSDTRTIPFGYPIPTGAM